MIDLISLGGNLGSLKRTFTRLNIKYNEVSELKDLSGDIPIVLPGVGYFGAVIENLRKTGLKEEIKRAVINNVPILGICAGMQILFEKSMENPEVRGMGLIEGDVIRFNAPKVPQIGWNLIIPVNNKSNYQGYVYFVNSFYCRPKDTSVVLFKSDYYGEFCAAVKMNNITGFQFHPEKSMDFGQDLIRKWYDAL